jgi:hypothetical protein
MSAKSTKGVQICISDPNTTNQIPLTVTAVSKAKPAVLTVDATAGVVEGAPILIPVGGTGFPELDGKTWIASAVTATEVTLIGSDTTASTGILAATPIVNVIPSSDMTCLCLSVFTINNETPGTVDVGTYCDPSATLPSIKVPASTVNFEGFVDIDSADYLALLAASEDGMERIMRVTLPNNGYLVAPVIISSLGWSFPLDGAQSFVGTAQLTSKFKHIF